MKLCNEQRNAQDFNLSIYICLTCSGLLLAHLPKQAHNFGNIPSLVNMVSAPGRWHHTQEAIAEIVHLPRKMAEKKARNM
jgi:hypothetical protein